MLMPLRDKYGKPIGYLEQQADHTFVRDVNYKLLGYTDKRGTFVQREQHQAVQ